MSIKIILLSYSLILISANAISVYNPMDITVNPIDIVVYPMDEDADGDGILNNRDAFPIDSNEWLDTDHDGIGNNADKDDDNDGIPDTVERANGLNPLNAADAQGDLDGDGFSNVIEYQMGTNMKSSRSKPVWAPVIMGDITIFIPAKP